MKVVILGTGNVANHLGMAIRNAGHSIIQVWGRTDKNVIKLSRKLFADPILNISEVDNKADIILIAVSDHAIAKVASQISKHKALVLHTSGSIGIDVLKKHFTNCGVLYPVQTFSQKRKLRLSKVPFCLESNNVMSRRRLLRLAHQISPNITWLSSGKRKVIHLAAVFANNFSNHMYVIAQEILKQEGIRSDLLGPLIMETAAKVQDADPVDMQTGPAIRGDKVSILAHVQLLRKHPEVLSLYSQITKSIQKHHPKKNH